jgi:hypothetical protein
MVSSATVTRDEEKRWLKKKNRKIDRGGDGHLDPRAVKVTKTHRRRRRPGKCLRLGLTLTEGPEPNPNKGTKIYHNLAHEWLHRCMIDKWTSRRRWWTRLQLEAWPQLTHTDATPNIEEKGRRQTKIHEPAPAVEQR